ncbi:MAG: aldo/keto reductase, partial [Sphingobacteriales bacterium]|nr:aldo/keto reductase [Sphingobacteriales bacterium]
KQLNDVAVKRGQSLAQMAIAWLMKDSRVTSVLIGASSVKQLDDNLAAMNNLAFNENELLQIEQILSS